MKVLISVVNPDEAIEALKGGADIVDIKDPAKGSLGAPNTALVGLIVRSLRSASHDPVPTSLALGDDPTKKETKELALVAGELNIDYVKAGSFGLKDVGKAIEVYRDLKVSVKRLKFVTVAYADHAFINCLSPIDLLKAAYRSDFDVFMIDTFIKNGMSTFDYLSVDKVMEIKELTHKMGLLFALAGSLGLSHVEMVRKVKPDIVGFRSAACGGDRVRQSVIRSRVRAIVEAYKSAQY
ncbi:MAG: (5-formylfuran-3-yl)methyl phosphate synthase [Candidatus Nezhaarchaeales archaeon]